MQTERPSTAHLQKEVDDLLAETSRDVEMARASLPLDYIRNIALHRLPDANLHVNGADKEVVYVTYF